MPEIVTIIAALFTGACVGSFIANAAWLWPDRLAGLLHKRSVCEHCQKHLGLVDLLPIAGWFIRRGRCSHCQAKIPAYYWPVELISACAAGLAVGWAGLASGALLAILAWVLILLSRIDLDSKQLPDIFTLPLMATGLALAALPFPAMPTLKDAIIGAAIGYGLLASIRLLYFKLRGIEGLGLGDAKLFAAAGAWCGWMALPWILLIAALTGLAMAIVQTKGKLQAQTAIPFGPALAIGFWFTALMQH